MALRAVAGGTGRVRDGVRTQGGAATPPAPPSGPSAFSFVDVTNATLSTVYTSNGITVAGMSGVGAISVTGGTYSINGGAYNASAGTVNNGDVVTVRVTSSASNSTSSNVVLTINAVSDTYTVTTTAAVAAPNAPTLAWSGTTTDNTPDLTLTFTAPQVSDVATVQLDTSNTFPSASSTTDTLDAGEVAANTVNLSLSTLTDGTYYARAKVTRSGVDSAWSNTVTITIATATAATTWNPADKASAITLASGNLAATGDVNNNLVRSTTSKTAGKWYYEVSVANAVTLDHPGIGIANASESLNFGYLGASNNSAGLFPESSGLGQIYPAGVGLPNCTFTTGSVVAVALDQTNGKMWWNVKPPGGAFGGWYGDPTTPNQDPATNTGGYTYPVTGAVFAAVSPRDTTTLTANFGQAAFAGAVPSGFTAWG